MVDRTLIRRQFQRHLIKGEKPETFDVCEPEFRDQLHAEIISRWAKTTPLPEAFNGRRLNHFCIGSDPEFVFTSINSGKHKLIAQELGLMSGLAFGCDQNMRLAELRGWPSTSAVEHVAGILASLRWMYRVYPVTRNLNWRAGAHFDGDGLGGHVHFGRKRPNRDLEVAALDGLATILFNGKFYNQAEWNSRRQAEGDQRRQLYGHLGDIRPQIHGYEYRTLPSWLCSPIKAFTIITAAKLCVLDPELALNWVKAPVNTIQDGLALLHNLSYYYAGRDDDAWILKHLTQRPEFMRQAASWETTAPCFRAAWGLDKTGWEGKENALVLPAVVQPAISEVAEMQSCLNELKPLGFDRVAPTFRSVLPAGYHWILQNGWLGGMQYGGAGDLLHNIVQNKGLLYKLSFGDNMLISMDIFKNWTLEEQCKVRAAFPDLRVSLDYTHTILFSRRAMGPKELPLLRELLFKWGLFAIWTVDSVKEDSLEKFLKHRKSLVVKPSTKKTPLERKL